MAISTSQSILAMLKVWYKDGVSNLMFRNSPLLNKIDKTRVEGKQQNFSAIYGRGGAVAARFTIAQQNAKQQTRNVEFEVRPGQIFSVYTMNGKEVQASLSKRGAYMKVAGNKMFAASEGFRKTMATALYGRGYGELCYIDATKNASLASIATTGTKVWLPIDAIMKIDIGTIIDVKASIATGTIVGSAEVTAIDGNIVTLAAQTSAISVTPGTHILALSGSVDASGNPLLPMGLDGWLPTVGNRVAGGSWDTYIANSFFGVSRANASDRLAGAFVVGASSEKYSVTVQDLLMKCRRQGSQADLIVMNDEDFLTLSKEIETTNTYFTQTSTKAKKEATVGFNSFAASFSTNYIDNIIDDPYCPKGKFYILDSSAVELFSYTNTEKLNDGVNGNNAGKQNPLDMEDEGKEKTPYGLIIDDYINVQPGSGSDDGPDVEVTLQFFGSLAVTNPSVCGVGIFDNNTTYIGYGL
mgnify:CR=1 FL=1